MRILHVYKDYFPVLGGIENHIRVLAEAQAEAGHQVIVLVCALGRRTVVEERAGVRVIKAGRWTTVASMPLSLSQPIAVARLQPDVIHVHSPYPLGELSAWLLKRHTPLVITHHSDVVRQRGWLKLYAPLLARVLAHATRIIATSPRYVETSPWLAPRAAKCVIVPLGVDETRFRPPQEPFNGPPTLLFTGRLRYYKGLDTLLEALVELPEVRLEVVGDGPQRREWETLTQRLGLGERVRFHGEVDDAELPGWYQRAHVFVLPANARAEAFGTVLLEAMASGLPCVTTEVGTGTSWVVQDGVNGRIVPPRSPYVLAQTIRSLVENPAQLVAMGSAARARVEAEFTQARMIERVEAVYRSVGTP